MRLTGAADGQSVQRTLILGVAVLAAALACAHQAAAAPGLVLGVDDDSLKWYAHTNSLLSIYRDLDLEAVRITLDWVPGESFPAGSERTELQRAANAGRSIRVVLAIIGPASSPPVDADARASFCGYAANVLRIYPWIHDVAIWTEPNSKRFWEPQKGSAAAYEALLATCWDALHAGQPQANVIATSAPHAKPAQWYAAVGKAYRASGRTLPIFDTVGHNAYPDSSAEAPAVRHRGSSIDEGDLDRLLATLTRAFHGTAQPLPGADGVSVWYLEDGFQTIPSAPQLYSGAETDQHPISEQEQASQLVAAVTLAYCQPDVGAFFNFELRDDASLAGWQSGLLRPDWSPKPSFLAFRAVAAAAADRTIACPAQ